MLPSEHMLYGLLISVLIFILFPPIGATGILVIFLASFLIDVDHYVYYIHNKKDLSLSRAVEFFVKMGRVETSIKKQISPLMMLHTIEFLVLLIILAFFNEIFIYVLIGIGIHLTLDAIHVTRHGIKHTRSYSILYSLFKKR